MYMMLLEDRERAAAVSEAVAQFDDWLLVYTIKPSAMDDAATKRGLRVVPEFFVDRGYFADGRVKMFDWKIEEAGGTPEAIAARAVRMVREGAVPALDDASKLARVQAQTICVHSDTPGSPEIARTVRAALERAFVKLRAPLSQW
jgi:UPF0271 protein